MAPHVASNPITVPICLVARIEHGTNGAKIAIQVSSVPIIASVVIMELARIDDMAFGPKKQGLRGSKGFQPFAWV